MKKLVILFQGAKEAAKQHCYINTEIKTTGFTYMDESIPPEVKEEISNLSEEVKNKMLLFTDEQVHDQLHKLLMEVEIEPIQVVFRDSQCLDCGAQGDLRILDNYCHMEMMFIHPKSAAYFHPETKVSTVKIGDKERFDKEQIGVKELFTDYQPFYTINLLLDKELLPI